MPPRAVLASAGIYGRDREESRIGGGGSVGAAALR
jgi:hypothetical protein